jgi:2-succinyl-6-hydroxy-2,4-cyclohexadiene-1-carboxylate synthase
VTGGPLHLTRHGRGPALVLLHGFTGSGRDMADVARPFEDSFEVLMPDLPGHARSAIASGYSFDRAVGDVLETLRAAGHDRACWLGYSMGARLALACAVRDPGSATALILIGARAGIADPAAREARRRADEALASRIESGGLEAFVDEWLAQPLFATQRRLGEAFLADARRARLGHRPESLAASLRSMGPGAQPPLFERLPHLDVPTLLVAGALDPKFGTLARDLAARLPQAEVREIAGAGHAVHLEQPEAFVRVAREFLGRTTPTAQTTCPIPVEETPS